MFDKSNFKSTKVDGVLSVVYDDKDAYKNGTDIPLKTLKEVAEYNSKYTYEATSAAVDYAKDQMKKDKDITKVNVQYPFATHAKSGVTVVIDREKTFHNPQNGEDITSVKVKDVSVNISKPKISGMVTELAKALSK